MGKLNEKVFLHFWPKCFIVFMGIIGIITVIILLLTELGNVAANFWLTNVFAGGWCGIILLIHAVLVLLSGKINRFRFSKFLETKFYFCRMLFTR